MSAPARKRKKDSKKKTNVANGSPGNHGGVKKPAGGALSGEE